MLNKKPTAIGVILGFASITAFASIILNLSLRTTFYAGIILFAATFVASQTAKFKKIIHLMNNFYILTGSIKTWVWDIIIVLFGFIVASNITVLPYPIRIFIAAYLGIYAGASLTLWSSFIYRNFLKKRDPETQKRKEKLSEIFKEPPSKETEKEILEFLRELAIEESKKKSIELTGNK